MKNLKVRPKFIIFVILSLMMFSNLMGDDKVIKVAFDEWPPWKMTKVDPISGIDAEILYAIEDRSDLKFEFVVAPWRRCIEMLKNSDVDMITSFMDNEERQEFATYIQPNYFIDKVRLYSRLDQILQIKNYEDLYKYKIGGVVGAHYNNRFDNDEQINIELVAHEDQLIKMLDARRIDLIINWETSFDQFVINVDKQNMITKYEFDLFSTEIDDAKYLNQSALYFAFSKKSDKLKFNIEISKILSSMIENGEVDRIINKFLKSIGENDDKKK